MKKTELTKENLIKLLDVMIYQNYKLADIWEKDGNEKMQLICMREAFAQHSILMLLEDEEYFNNVWRAYFDKED